MPEIPQINPKDVPQSEQRTGYQFRLLTDQEKNLFRNLPRDSSQFPLTRDLLGKTEIQPTGVVSIFGTDFFVGKVLKTDDRDQAIMFVKNEKGFWLPRGFYKSISDGGWRSCPYTDGTHYSKGSDIHYTQETKPHQSLIRYLDESEALGHIAELWKKFGVNPLPMPGRPRGIRNLLYENFQYRSTDSKPLWYTYDQEVKKYNDMGILSQFQRFPPGDYGKESMGTDFAKAFEEFDFYKNELKGFLPDFKKQSLSILKVKHTLLGPITLEAYDATLNGRPIQWVMGFDRTGRVWIDRIAFMDVGINTYGISPEVIDSGALTNKPIEYHSQIAALKNDRDYRSFNDQYADITPLLDHLLPIKQFRLNRSISPERIPGKKVKQTINEARNFDELTEAIKQTGGLQGAKDFYPPDELLRIVNDVRLGKLDVTYVTRTGGLRDKVAKFLYEQRRR